MKRLAALLLVVVPVLVSTQPVDALESDSNQPVYVGATICAHCHSGPNAGHTYSLWRSSSHAKAYASLWSEESKKIAKLSGITEEPQEASSCLGCHSTAWDVEEWELDETFRIENGVQCEQCHGPGSAHAGTGETATSEQAAAQPLRSPGERDCLMCHKVKGSHVAVLGSPEFDFDSAWKRIAHTFPGQREPSGQTRDPEHSDLADESEEASPPKYTGVWECAQCHSGKEMGYQFSRWRMGPHANAWAMLAGEEAHKIAEKMGVEGDPQRIAECLSCHTTGADDPAARLGPAFDVREGVQCESCHGAGSEYSAEAVMRDPKAASDAGLKPIGVETCLPCHGKAHGRSFDFDTAVAEIAHPTHLAPSETAIRYKTPLNLAVRPDGREIYVACEGSGSVIVVDVELQEAVAEIPVGGQATDVTFSSDGSRAYVTSRLEDSVSVVNVVSREVIEIIDVGDEPHGLLLDRDERYLYVLNTTSDDISVIDAVTFEEKKRLSASRSPWSLALSPDGGLIAATNTLSRFVPFRQTSISEITLIQTDTGMVSHRAEVPDANLCMGIDWHPSGDFALFTLDRTKNLIPMTRLLQGWTITNGLGVLWRDGRVDQVLLDEPHLAFADPTDVAISPDGRFAFVTSSGTDRVAVVDTGKLVSLIQNATAYERTNVLPNHLGKPTEFIVGHVPTRDSPRGVTFSPDGAFAYVANALDDSLTVIEVKTLDAVNEIDLGGPKEIDKVRRGERLFHSANITFRRQFSCHTCHPDGHVDGITYDIEPDGIGISPVDNRTLRGILDTAPFKWEGTNVNLERQCGPRLAVFFTRIDPFTQDELTALTEYICTIPRPPNRFRPLGGDLTPAQRRGKAVFKRSRTNDGRTIPEGGRCVTCHFPPLYTDRSRHNVGTKMPLDREERFDTPHLTNIYDSAPYLHNGIAATLEEIWTRFNPDDRHGVTNDLTKDELNDLIEYLKTL